MKNFNIRISVFIFCLYGVGFFYSAILKEDNGYVLADAPLPDLAIDSITFDPNNHNRISTVTIINHGSVSTQRLSGRNDHYNVTLGWIYANGSVVRPSSGNNLGNVNVMIPPGGIYRFAVHATGLPDWPTPPANARGVRITVDPSFAGSPGGLIAESNENNNSRDFSIPVLPLPDLAIDSITFDPNNHNRISTVTIINHGSVSTQRLSGRNDHYNVTLSWIYANGSVIRPSSGNNLGNVNVMIPPRGVYRFEVHATGLPDWPTPPANARGVRITVDPSFAGSPGGLIAESNENNNSRDFSIPSRR